MRLRIAVPDRAHLHEFEGWPGGLGARCVMPQVVIHVSGNLRVMAYVGTLVHLINAPLGTSNPLTPAAHGFAQSLPLLPPRSPSKNGCLLVWHRF